MVCGLSFSQVSGAMLLITLGVGLTLANNIMSYSFHAYQTELFPTGIRAQSGGLRIFLEPFVGDFHLVSHRRLAQAIWHDRRIRVHRGSDADSDVAIAFMGPRTKGIELEKISQ